MTILNCIFGKHEWMTYTPNECWPKIYHCQNCDWAKKIELGPRELMKLCERTIDQHIMVTLQQNNDTQSTA